MLRSCLHDQFLSTLSEFYVAVKPEVSHPDNTVLDYYTVQHKICCTLYVFVVPYVYLLYYTYVCIAILTLDAGLLARSQYPEGPATSHLDTGFSWCPSVYKRMLRWFPSSQVATTCFSCSPPDLNFLVTFFFIFV